MDANASEASAGPAEAMEKVDWHFARGGVVSDVEELIIDMCLGLKAIVVRERAGRLLSPNTCSKPGLEIRMKLDGTT